MVLSHRRDCTPLPPVGTLREPAHTEVSLKTGKSQPLPFFFQFTGHQRNILWTLTSYYHSPSEADSMQKEENAGGRVHVHQRFSRKNTHVLRGLKIVENGPCSCGFSEHLSKHTQNIRQIVPTNVDHCLNSKSSFCIILFWYRRGNSAIKKYQKVFFFFLWPSVSRSLRSLASPACADICRVCSGVRSRVLPSLALLPGHAPPLPRPPLPGAKEPPLRWAIPFCSRRWSLWSWGRCSWWRRRRSRRTPRPSPRWCGRCPCDGTCSEWGRPRCRGWWRWPRQWPLGDTGQRGERLSAARGARRPRPSSPWLPQGASPAGDTELPNDENPQRRRGGGDGFHRYIWRFQHFPPRSWLNDETENQEAFRRPPKHC